MKQHRRWLGLRLLLATAALLLGLVDGLDRKRVPRATAAQGPADEVRIDLVGQVGGAAGAITKVGDTAYVGIGSRLTILDVSDPSSPIRVGQTPPFGGLVRGVDVVDNRAYVASSTDGYLQVVDVEDPRQPRTIGGLRVGGLPVDVAVVTSTAYVATFSGQIQIVDVAKPEAPKALGDLVGAGLPRAVQVLGDRLFVADTVGLRIWDIRSRAKPTLLGELELGDLLALHVVDDVAYVANRKGGADIVLTTIDVGDDRTPAQIGELSLERTGIYDVRVENGTAALAIHADGAAFVDVTNPAKPRLLARLAVDRETDQLLSGTNLVFSAGQVGLTLEQGGVAWIDASRPEMPRQLGRFEAPGHLDRVAGSITSGIAVGSGARPDRVWGIDIREPDALKQRFVLGMANLKDVPRDVEASDDRLYVVGYDINIIEAASPDVRPTVMGPPAPLGNPAERIAIHGNSAYVAVRHGAAETIGTILTLDVAGDGARVVGRVETRSASDDIVVIDSWVYVVSEHGDLQVFDARDRTQLTEAGSFPLSASGIDVVGTHAYAVSRQTGLHVLDVSDPTDIRAVGTLPVFGRGGIAVAWPWVIMTGQVDQFGPYGLTVVDVRVPGEPRVVATAPSAGHARDLWLGGDHVFMADGGGGLAAYRLSASSPVVLHLPAAFNRGR